MYYDLTRKINSKNRIERVFSLLFYFKVLIRRKDERASERALFFLLVLLGIGTGRCRPTIPMLLPPPGYIRRHIRLLSCYILVQKEEEVEDYIGRRRKRGEQLTLISERK